MHNIDLSDPYGRMLNYLRVSVTDRCNLHCMYCRKPGHENCEPRTAILRYEEILRLIRVGAGMGIEKVRITGGEPLVRKGLLSFVKQTLDIPGIRDVSLTTNGLRLGSFLTPLKDMGVRRLNISLDSLNRKTFRDITGTDGLQTVLSTIIRAISMGFSPIKLNMVVLRGINDHEIHDFAGLTRILPLNVRFIEYMPASDPLLDPERQVLGPEIKKRIAQTGRLIPIISKDSSRIAERFRFEDGCGEMGLISPVSKHFCRACNRLRLTSNGKLRPCLLSNRAVDVSDALKKEDDDGIRKGLLTAAELKPRYSDTEDNQHVVVPRFMSAIGG